MPVLSQNQTWNRVPDMDIIGTGTGVPRLECLRTGFGLEKTGTGTSTLEYRLAVLQYKIIVDVLTILYWS